MIFKERFFSDPHFMNKMFEKRNFHEENVQKNCDFQGKISQKCWISRNIFLCKYFLFLQRMLAWSPVFYVTPFLFEYSSPEINSTLQSMIDYKSGNKKYWRPYIFLKRFDFDYVQCNMFNFDTHFYIISYKICCFLLRL